MQPIGRPPTREQVTQAPKVFGVLSIVFASLVLLFGLFGLAAGALPSVFDKIGKATSDPAAQATLDSFKKIYGGIGAIGLIQVLMSGLLLAIGIGQLRYRRWARSWSIGWGVLGLVCVVGMILISTLMIGPGYRELFSAAALRGQEASASSPDLNPLGAIFGGMFGVTFVLFYAPYPILLLAFFTRDRLRAAMVF